MFEHRSDGFLHRRIDVGEVTLHVAEARPSGIAVESDVPKHVPLVVFLHGFPDFWWSWRKQLKAMADAGYWAVAPDLRGYNESDKPKGVAAYEIEKLAADVAGLVHALGRKSAIIVGHDWGAMVAWAFAQTYPETLRRLAILNVPHPAAFMRGLRRPAQLRKSWYMFFFQIPFVAEQVLAARDFGTVRWIFRSSGYSPDEIDRQVEAFRTSVPTSLAYYRAAIRRVVTGRTPKLATIERPVLVIWGDRDVALGKELADPPARFVPNVNVVHIPEATHFVQHDAPEQVNELLLQFVSEER